MVREFPVPYLQGSCVEGHGLTPFLEGLCKERKMGREASQGEPGQVIEGELAFLTNVSLTNSLV